MNGTAGRPDGVKDAALLYGVKEALHAMDRRNERTPGLHPDTIPHLQAAADRLDVPPGQYYLPLTDDHGTLVGYAAFKTVDGYPRHRLVLATILGAQMTPKGASLSHVMQQPRFPPMQKAAELVVTTEMLEKMADVATGPELPTPEGYTPETHKELNQNFGKLQQLVREKGVLAGTAHNRIAIPKNIITEHDLTKGLGFQPVTIAIPEAGQDRFQSWRHPDHNFHVHSHGDVWTMYEDGHAAATMLAKKAKGVAGKARAMVQGLPHVNEEGLPGLYYYVKGQLGGHRSTAARVLKELPDDVKNTIRSFAPSSTYVAPREAEFTGKVAALATYGVTTVVKTAAEQTEENDPHPMAGVAAGLGATALLPGAAMAYGAHRGLKGLEQYKLVNPAMVDTARNFAGMDHVGRSPEDYLREYATHGSDLSRQHAVTTPKGDNLTGQGLIDHLRSGPLGNLATAAGLSTPYTPESKQHYSEFAKGPSAAFAQMAHEIDPNMGNSMRGDVLGARYEAATKSLRNGNIHPSLFRKNLREVLHTKGKWNPAHLAQFTSSLESQMQNADPKMYMEHLKAIAQGRDGAPIQEKMFDRVVGKGRDTRSMLGREINRFTEKPLDHASVPLNTQQQLLKHQLSPSNIAGSYAAMKTFPAFKEAPKMYAPLIKGLDKYKGLHDGATKALRSVRGVGGAMALGGAALAGLGVYGAMRKKAPAPEEKTAGETEKPESKTKKLSTKPGVSAKPLGRGSFDKSLKAHLKNTPTEEALPRPLKPPQHLEGVQEQHSKHQLNLEHATEKTELHPLTRKLLDRSPVKVTVDPGAYGEKPVQNGYYDLIKKEIGVQNHAPDTLAHEIGHALFDQSPIGNILQSRYLYPRIYDAPLASFGAGVAGGMTRRGGGTVSPLMLALGIGIPSLMSAPALISEGVASYKGHNELKQVGATPEQLANYRRSMMRGYGSYLGLPLGGVATGALGYGAGRWGGA